MKRVAFTIIYNGLHHLRHNEYWRFIVDNFDHWVIVEGAAMNGGSTSWCKPHPGGPRSDDGTIPFIIDIASTFGNVSVVMRDSFWNSKDEMVNAALDKMAESIPLENDDHRVFLWEIDADEQWSLDAISENESFMIAKNATVGAVRWNHFVSSDLIAVGDWGGNLNTRLWYWSRVQRFEAHEPPKMIGCGQPIELPGKCNHFAYYFERDVFFKSQYYGGHERVYDGWLKLQINKEREKIRFPLHISFLFGRDNWIGKSDSHIIEIGHEKKA